MNRPVYLTLMNQKTCFACGHPDHEIKDCKQRVLQYRNTHKSLSTTKFSTPSVSYAQAVKGKQKVSISQSTALPTSSSILQQISKELRMLNTEIKTF